MKESTVRVHPIGRITKYANRVGFDILEYAIYKTNPIENLDFWALQELDDFDFRRAVIFLFTYRVNRNCGKRNQTTICKSEKIITKGKEYENRIYKNQHHRSEYRSTGGAYERAWRGTGLY